MTRLQQKREQQAVGLIQQGHLEEAEIIYRKLLEEGACSYIIFANLAAVYGMQGRTKEVVPLLKKAIAINSSYPEDHFNLGIALYNQGDLEAATTSFRQALAINPHYPEALFSLGNALHGQGNLQAAIDAYRQALAVKPDYPEAYSNLGIALHGQGNLQAAIDAYRQALAIKPNFPDAYYNLGNALRGQDNLQAAIAAYRQALAIKPNFPDAYSSLGIALRNQGDLQAAIAAYRQALAIKPDFPKAHMNLSLVQLLLGDYENGWKEYEWRFRVQDRKTLLADPQVQPWTGSNLAPGERLILVSEQGLGDTLQFMRYVLYLNNTGLPVSLCAQIQLHDLIHASRITTMIYNPEETNQLTIGKWLPLLSLPVHLQILPDKPIVDAPYIQVPEQQVGHWQQKLAHEQQPVVGINWQGNPEIEKDSLKGRSLPLESFAIITEKTTVTLLSLQKGFGSEQLADCPFRHRFVRCQEEINRTWDFVEAAAIIANCDLVITSDTVVAHLAAGMGHPTWLLLTKVPDWRWGMEGDTSFWYPSMRLFRQRERGNWQEVMDRVATALAAFVGSGNRTSEFGQNAASIHVPVAFAELIDKITILEIKSETLTGHGKVNVDHELSLLRRVLKQSGVQLLPEHYEQLKSVNQSLWNVEDDIRDHERRQDFGEQFIQLARSVYEQNDRRAAIKRSINDHYGSAIREEKSYS